MMKKKVVFLLGIFLISFLNVGEVIAQDNFMTVEGFISYVRTINPSTDSSNVIDAIKKLFGRWSSSQSPQVINAWFESATYKVRPEEIIKDVTTYSINSAKNEFEPFQLILRSDIDRNNIDVEISDFTGTNGNSGVIGSGNVTIFKVGYIRVTSPSDVDGESGDWPDILMPKIDAYFHEQRNFFPFSLEQNQLQPIWFDLFVPNSSNPGDYIATVTVTENGNTIFTGNINLRVWDFSLPATSSLKSTFLQAYTQMDQGHYGDASATGNWISPLVISGLMELYIRAGLRHRITLSGAPVWFSGWDGDDYSSVLSQHYLNSIEGLSDAGHSEVEYGNSKLTALSADFGSIYYRHVVSQGLCSSASSPPQSLLDETRRRAEHYLNFLSTNERDIFYVLPFDEPGATTVGCGNTLDYISCKEQAMIIKDVGLNVHFTKGRRNELLNTSNNPPTNDYTDRWIVYMHNIAGRDWSGADINNRDSYHPDELNGAEVWWYQGCQNHGCGIYGNDITRIGTPEYSVEYSAMHSRIFPWMSYKYDLHGEFYYAVNEWEIDPWLSLWSPRYYANGDGVFFYPGIPSKEGRNFVPGGRGENTPEIGGVHDIPIESIRLKMIREGYEDYEYLNLLKQLGDGDFAKAQVDLIVSTTYNFSKDHELLYEVRKNIAERIESLI